MLRIGCLLGVLVVTAGIHEAAAQPAEPLLPVGVRYSPAADPDERRRELEELQRLRFNVVVETSEGTPPGDEVMLSIDRLLEGGPLSRAAVDVAGTRAEIDVARGAQAPLVYVRAWTALARGARAVIFNGWSALREEVPALEAASEFAGHVTRNAVLYAPLRPRTGTGDLRVDGAGGAIEAALLESEQALVLVAANHADEPQTPVITFSPEIPEAIWQNMLTGGAVHFVAGTAGPTYTHAFAPYEVLVLMIQKRWR